MKNKLTIKLSSTKQLFLYTLFLELVLILLAGQQAESSEKSFSQNIIPDNKNLGRDLESMPLPPQLRGPMPDKKEGLPTPKTIDKPESQQALQSRDKLDDIVEETIKSAGSLFIDPEQVIVKPPLLTALISLDDRLTPYQLDASSNRSMTLQDILSQAFGNNLNMKISDTESQMRRYKMFSSFGGFLPNLVNEISYQGLTGQYISPGSIAIPIHNYYLNTNTGFQWYVFRGGGILYTFLQDKHLYKASKHAFTMITNDTLAEVAKQYYQLALNDILLQIKIKSTEVSSTLLLINQDLFANGVNTLLEVLQAKTQLSRDRQNLIKQQVERRQAAVKLATTINFDPVSDILLSNRNISKTRLISKDLLINDLLKIAIENRPELKRYEELRQAAKDQIKVARAPLLPQIYISGATAGTFAKINKGNAFSQSQNQQLPFSTTGGATTGSVSGSGSSLPVSGSSTSGGRSKGGRSLFIAGVDMQWQIGGLGVTNTAQIYEAKAEARRRQLEFSRELNRIYEQVRDSYLSSLSSENLIIETTDAVNSSAEQLRVAKDRLENGVGTNLDVINAQRDYTSALIDKANAIIQFNIAQVELLKDIGRISVSTLVSPAPLKQ